jgi:hypothetical protein
MLDLILRDDHWRAVELAELRRVSSRQVHATFPVLLKLLVDLSDNVVDPRDVTSTSERRQLVYVLVVFMDSTSIVVIQLPKLPLEFRTARAVSRDRNQHSTVKIERIDRVLPRIVVVVG